MGYTVNQYRKHTRKQDLIDLLNDAQPFLEDYLSDLAKKSDATSQRNFKWVKKHLHGIEKVKGPWTNY